VDILETHQHLTSDEIIAYVQSRMLGVHKSTIYRTLELLEEAGCVYKSEMGDQFIYHHAEEGHHHHLERTHPDDFVALLTIKILPKTKKG